MLRWHSSQAAKSLCNTTLRLKQETIAAFTNGYSKITTLKLDEDRSKEQHLHTKDIPTSPTQSFQVSCFILPAFSFRSTIPTCETVRVVYSTEGYRLELCASLSLLRRRSQSAGSIPLENTAHPASPREDQNRTAHTSLEKAAPSCESHLVYWIDISPHKRQHRSSSLKHRDWRGNLSSSITS